MHHTQAAALAALAEGLAKLFSEAVELLPRMVEAAKGGKPLPRRNPERWASICANLCFVQGGRAQYLTLASLDGTKVSYRLQEALVWIALDATTCLSIENDVPGVTRAPGLFAGLGARQKPGPDPTLMQAYARVLMLNTQNIAIRAAFLTQFLRFSIAYIAKANPESRFAPAMELAQKHFAAFQSDIERHVSSLVDGPAAAALCTSLSFPSVPLIVAEVQDANTETLNGVPMNREHKAAWLAHLASLQAAPKAQATG